MALSRIALTAFATFLVLAACSEDADPAGGERGADAGAESNSSNDAGPDEGIDSGADAATTLGIRLTVNGTAYSLTTNPAATQSGNGWAVQAAEIDGTKVRTLGIILTKADAAMSYEPLTPGTYPCVTPGAGPFMWGRMQYSTPDGTTYQSPSSASCSVTLTAFGVVGSTVKGSFSASLNRVAGAEDTPIEVSGTFEVTRTN